MAKYRCTVCGYIFDEEKEGKSFSELESCEICGEPKEAFELIEEGDNGVDDNNSYEPSSEQANQKGNKQTSNSENSTNSLKYSDLRYAGEIHKMAVSGETIYAAMATSMRLPSWDDILIMGAQLDPMPLADDADIDTKIVIGKNAKQPMILDNPLYVSHMSFGALSREAKIALSKGAAQANCAMCSGEGGILEEEQSEAYQYIFEYVPNEYSVTDENLRKVDAIEIKIGQGTKPGMGGHLPGEKVSEEIAAVRNKPVGKEIHSPSTFPNINNKDDLKGLVENLRQRSEGRPIGVKLAAGNIEADIDFAIYAEADFITVDGRGGSTGSSPFFMRESTSIPTIYALSRARKYLDKVGSDMELVITGGLRVSSDCVKAIALGADAIALATSPLVAAACQQYKVCGTGRCPVGLATQDEELRSRFDDEEAVQRIANFFKVSVEELKSFARITGHRKLCDFNVSDIRTTDRDIAKYTDIKHVGEV